MLGEKLKELRELRGLLQRQVAAELDVDTAYISKMESNDKPVSKTYLSKLAKLYEVDEQDLLTLWLADKVYDVVKDQELALKAMEVAEEEIKSKRRSNPK
jgi:transcriptional regulator with XRE-family HTH domain